MSIDISKIKTSALRALVGNVPPNLRAVSVHTTAHILYVYFYYDNPMSADDKEFGESTMDQIISDFNRDETGKEIEFKYSYHQIGYPKKIPLNGLWVYFRYEPPKDVFLAKFLNLYKSQNHQDSEKPSFIPQSPIRARWLLSIQQAMLHKITSNLRYIIVNHVEESFFINFYYENKPSKEEIYFLSSIAKEFQEIFESDGQQTKMKYHVSSHVISYPQKPQVDGIWVYGKGEPLIQDSRFFSDEFVFGFISHNGSKRTFF